MPEKFTLTDEKLNEIIEILNLIEQNQIRIGLILGGLAMLVGFLILIGAIGLIVTILL